MNTYPLLIEIVWKSALFVAVVGLIVLTVKGRVSASARHLLWAIALFGALLMPVITLVSPKLKVAIPARISRDVAHQSDSENSDQAVNRELSLQMRAFSQQRYGELPGNTREQKISSNGAGLGSSHDTALLSSTSGSSNARTTRPINFDWRGFILLVWLIGAGGLLLRLVISHVIVCEIVRKSEPATFDHIGHLETLDRVKLIIAPELLGEISPMTFGAVKPLVLLPYSFSTWSEQRRQAALLHELAHISRFDWLIQTIGLITCAIYWFNPLVWYASKQLKVESERASDDLVITSRVVNATDYAQHLIEITRTLRSVRALTSGAVAMAQPGKIEQRLHAILADNLPRGVVSHRAGAVIAVVAFLVVGLAGSLKMVAAEGTKANPTIHHETETETYYGAPMIVTDSDQVTLPNGATVSLVGICNSQDDGKQWWTTTGAKLNVRHMTRLLPFTYLNGNYIGRIVDLKVTINTSEQPMFELSPRGENEFWLNQSWKSFSKYEDDIIPSFPPPVVGTPQNMSLSSQSTRSDDLCSLELYLPEAFKSTHQSSDVTLGVATGKYSEYVKCPKQLGSTRVNTTKGSVTFTYIPNPKNIEGDGKISIGNTAFMVSDHLGTGSGNSPLYDREVLGLDQQGRVVKKFRGDQHKRRVCRRQIQISMDDISFVERFFAYCLV